MSEEKTKKPIFKKWWFWAIIVVIVIAIGANAGGSGDKAATTGTPSAQPSTPTKSAPVEAIKVTAVDLAAAYEGNEVKADQTYKDKLADITGTVKDIGVSLGQTYVVLSAGKDFAVTEVQCFFKDQTEIDKVANLKKGGSVTIQGTIDGKSLNVTVNNCTLKK